jgi:hypothetical protein
MSIVVLKLPDVKSETLTFGQKFGQALEKNNRSLHNE